MVIRRTNLFFKSWRYKLLVYDKVVFNRVCKGKSLQQVADSLILTKRPAGIFLQLFDFFASIGTNTELQSILRTHERLKCD